MTVAFIGGVVCAVMLGLMRSRRAGIHPGHILAVTVVCLIAGFIGSKLFHGLFHMHHFRNPIEFLKGGVTGSGVFGALFCAIPAALWYLSRVPQGRWRAADMIAPSIALLTGFGRLGCYATGCCFGKPTSGFLWTIFPTSTAAGSVFPGVPLLPTQFIQAVDAFLILGISLIMERRKHFDGFTFCLVFFLYGLERFIIDFFRYYETEQMLSFVAGYDVPVTQIFALVLAGSALFLGFRLRLQSARLSGGRAQSTPS